MALEIVAHVLYFVLRNRTVPQVPRSVGKEEAGKREESQSPGSFNLECRYQAASNRRLVCSN